MEQVLRTVSALNDAGFTQITMYETLLRQMDVAAYPQAKSVQTAADRLKESAVKKEHRRLAQIESSKRTRERTANQAATEAAESGEVLMEIEVGEEPESGPSSAQPPKRKADVAAPDATAGQPNGSDEPPSKRSKTQRLSASGTRLSSVRMYPLSSPLHPPNSLSRLHQQPQSQHPTRGSISANPSLINGVTPHTSRSQSSSQPCIRAPKGVGRGHRRRRTAKYQHFCLSQQIHHPQQNMQHHNE